MYYPKLRPFVLFALFFLTVPSFAAQNCAQLYHNALQAGAKAQMQLNDLLKKCPDLSGEILFSLGSIAQQQKHSAQAQDYYQQSVEKLTPKAAKSAEYALKLADSQQKLGDLARLAGDYAAAEQAYMQALNAREKSIAQAPLSVANSLNDLGLLYDRQGLYEKAESALKRALELKQAHLPAEDYSLSTSLNNLALVYTNAGRYAEAEPLYQQALHIRQKILPADDPRLARSLHNLALLYEHLGNREKAQAIYEQVLELREKTLGKNHPDVANTLHQLGLLAHEQKQLDKAAPFYLRALDIKEKALGAEHPTLAVTLSALAALYRSQGKTQQAEALHQHAVSIQAQKLGIQHPNYATGLTNLAFLYTQAKDFTRAEDLYLRALYAVSVRQTPEERWFVQYSLSEALRRQGALRAAIFFAKQAVNTLQGLRLNVHDLPEHLRQHFLQDKAPVYEQLADTLLSQGRLLEAQQVLSMLREEQYFDFIERDNAADLRRTHADLNPQEVTWEVEQQIWQEKLEQGYADWQQAPQEETKQQAWHNTMQAFYGWLQQLKQTEPEHKTATATLPPEALQKLLNALGEGTVLLQFLSSDQQVRTILTSATQQTTHKLSWSRTELNRQLLAFHALLQDPAQDPRELGHSLYQVLLQPLEPALQAARTQVIMLAPDGPLHYIPLAALHDGKQYVAQRYALVRYTAAAQHTLLDKPQAQWQAVGLGLSQAVGDFNPLPTVERELEGIIQSTATDPSGVLPGKILLNQDFNQDNLQAALNQDYPLLHIASHFIFEPGTEQASYLLLGNGDKLSLAQVRADYRFDHLDLLTLSACDTAVGASGGQEIEGFGALAQHQGAKGVLATLWPVNDDSTGVFMQRFYQGRVQQGLSKAAALQAAQIAFIQAGQTTDKNAVALPYFYQHPYYWAAFILLGNWL